MIAKITSSSLPTLWGLTPIQLHDRFWAARGVQVVRLGERSEIVDDAELFLLTSPQTLAIFKLMRPVDVISWIKPDVLFLRIRDDREYGYREHVIRDGNNGFLRFQRDYGGLDARMARVALTPHKRIALIWQASQSIRSAWNALREEIDRSDRSVLSIKGKNYNIANLSEVAEFTRELAFVWKQPDSTIPRTKNPQKGIWIDSDAQLDPAAMVSGNLWIGAGRKIQAGDSVVGPKILWDDPDSRPQVQEIKWLEIEPSLNLNRVVKPRQINTISKVGKRAFDIVFSLLVLLLTLPVYPLLMLAIWLEDGRPFFFSHKRETRGGREFPCIKFRSMRKNADEIKKQLVAENQADGPQFFIANDPRLTAVGKFIRKTNLDELPQFINVLLGHMSVVGPRPSPRSENQFCPEWREARLSVRPGITGLWQVSRTRRKGLDFQEWIRFDLQYVENMSIWLDIKIILQTFHILLRGVIRS